MKIIITIFIFIITGFTNLSYGQNSYRIKSYDDKGDFIYPPHSKLKHNRQNTNLKRKYRYHYIYIDSLKMIGGDYYSTLNVLNKAEYFTSIDPINKICFDTQCHWCSIDLKAKGTERKSFNESKSKLTTKEITKLKNNFALSTKEAESKICDIVTDTIGNFCYIKYSYDQKAFLLQIDYEKIFTDNPDKEIQKLRTIYDKSKLEMDSLSVSNSQDIEMLRSIDKTISALTKTYEYNISPPGIVEKRFFEIAKDLLLEFNKRENEASPGFGWPSSISQNLVEKIFELIPIPQKASLTRYFSQIDIQKSFILLNPKIKLSVNAEDILNDENDNWQYRFINSNLLTLTKDNRGNTIQSPFLNFQYKTVSYMPTNNISGKNILQASSADIQLSSTLNKCPFIFLFQNNFKKSSKFSSTDCTSCGGKEWNMFEANSVLYHYKTIPEDFYNDDELFDKKKINHISAFGYRNVITPIISIYLNNNPCDIILNTTVEQVKLQYNLPTYFTMLRLYNGKYKRVNFKFGNDIILLPSDIIKF